MAQIGLTPDEVLPTDIDETPRPRETPRLLAARLAGAKADAAAALRPGAFVVAADTVVGAGRRILPKAETPEQARACLTLLSGRRHHVWTGLVVVAPDGRRARRLVDSIVTFQRLTPQQVDAYLASLEWRGKAGGYAIQGRAAAHVRFIAGSHSAIVGLPLFELAQCLRGLGHPVP